MIYLVTIQDKELPGEPDIGMCVVDADSEEDAIVKSKALDRCYGLANGGRGRCVPHVRRWELNVWCRVTAMIRVPYKTDD